MRRLGIITGTEHQAISEALENLTAGRGQGDPSAAIWLDDKIAADSPTPPQT